jgi:hypothetical protein
MIAAVVAMFTLTTIPMIRSNVTLPVGTSLPMTLGSILLAIAYLTLGLWFALSVEVVSTVLWTILLIRTFKYV